MAFEIHEAANIFPLEEETIPALAEDIKQNGQREPIALYEGKLLDGRRRLRACELAGVEPTTKQVTEDPVAYVISLNLHRRQLTKSEAAMAAARAEALGHEIRKRARERQTAQLKRGGDIPVVEALPQRGSGGKSRDELGAKFGVAGKTVDQARKILTHGTPELIGAVDAGKISVNRGSGLARCEPDTQKEIIAATKEGGKRKKREKQKTEPDEDRKPSIAECPGGDKQYAYSEAYADATAEYAITELRRIPKRSKYRVAAFHKTLSWIEGHLHTNGG